MAQSLACTSVLKMADVILCVIFKNPHENPWGLGVTILILLVKKQMKEIR